MENLELTFNFLVTPKNNIATSAGKSGLIALAHWLSADGSRDEANMQVYFCG